MREKMVFLTVIISIRLFIPQETVYVSTSLAAHEMSNCQVYQKQYPEYCGKLDIPSYFITINQIFLAKHFLYMFLLRQDDCMVDGNHERPQQDNDRV